MFLFQMSVTELSVTCTPAFTEVLLINDLVNEFAAVITRSVNSAWIAMGANLVQVTNNKLRLVFYIETDRNSFTEVLLTRRLRETHRAALQACTELWPDAEFSFCLS